MSTDWMAMPGFLDQDAPGMEPVPGSGGQVAKSNRDRAWVIPHERMFASIWQSGTKSYWFRHDEALRRSYTDALAMRRDPVIHACLRRRQTPTSAIPYAIEPEDPTDDRQRIAARVIDRLIRRVPRFKDLRMSLLEAIFFGRAGVQMRYAPIMVDGIRLIGVKDHHPINGDKIVRRWNGTPGVLVNASWAANTDRDGPRPWIRKHIELSGHYGYALWLETRALRDRYIIHSFEPTDTDYLYEGDLAGAIHGLGLRSRLWHPWNLRNEIASWALDALQKIGANGMLYGRFPHGNADAEDKVLEILAKLSKDHLAAIPYVPGQSGDEDIIRSIPVNPVGYDILATFQNMYEGQIREIINGDSPTAGPSADTRKSAELTEDARMSQLRADAMGLQETLTDQLVEPLLRMNRDVIEELTGGPIDYRMRLKLQIDRPGAIEDLQAAQLLVGIFSAMGIQQFPIDPAHLIDIAGLRPPDGGTIDQEMERIAAEKAGQAMPPPQPGMIPMNQGPPQGPGGPAGGIPEGEAPPEAMPNMPRGEAPADGTPPDLLQNLARPTTSQGGTTGRYAADRMVERYEREDSGIPESPAQPLAPTPIPATTPTLMTRGQKRVAKADAEIARQKAKAEGLKEYQRKGTDAPSFRRWFEGSKVADPETGEPRLLSHVTKDKRWTKFDPSKTNPGNFYGQGLYVAEGRTDEELDYGVKVESAVHPHAGKRQFYYNLKNPFVSHEHAIPAPYVGEKISEILPPNASDRLRETFSRQVREAIARDGVGEFRDPQQLLRLFTSVASDMKNGIINLADPEGGEDGDGIDSIPDDVYEEFRRLAGKVRGKTAEASREASDPSLMVTRLLQSLGYDGVSVPGRKYHVAFEPHQIKSKANFGTFDPESEHIHHAAENRDVMRYSKDPEIPPPPPGVSPEEWCEILEQIDRELGRRDDIAVARHASSLPASPAARSPVSPPPKAPTPKPPAPSSRSLSEPFTMRSISPREISD